jgi:hypothetical protein
MKNNVLVFDVETIADLTTANRDAIAALAKGREMTAEAYGGLCPPLARVVCLSWFDLTTQKLGAVFDQSLCGDLLPACVAVESGGETRTVTSCDLQGCEGEADLLRRFGGLVARHLGQPNAQLVTFSGRGFDLPVLIHRSIKHGVTEGRELLMKAMAENRYRPQIHLDLLDVVTFYGAAPRFPLAAYAVGYGWRSPKEDMHGSEVGGAVQAGRLLDVVRYCAGDVLATSHVYACINARPAVPPDVNAA